MEALKEQAPAFTVGLVALALVAQHFLCEGARGAEGHWLRQAAAGVAMVALVAVAAVVLELAPYELGLALPQSAAAMGWAGLAMGVMVTGSYLASRQPDFRRHYPEAPVDRWRPRSWLANTAAWAVYLVGYELLFRGLCLGVLCSIWGTVSGVAVTTALYVVAHLPKNLSESLGSFPMGVVMAALTLTSGSLVPAFALHLVMAVAADTLALRAAVGEGGGRDVNAPHPASEGSGG